MANNKINSTQIKDDIWHEVGAAGEPAFANNWVNYGSGFTTAAFRKDSMGFVHLKGLVKTGTVNTTIFTLPAGYRPALTSMFVCVGNTGSAEVSTRNNITNVGAVRNNSSLNAYLSLDGITFKAEL